MFGGSLALIGISVWVPFFHAIWLEKTRDLFLLTSFFVERGTLLTQTSNLKKSHSLQQISILGLKFPKSDLRTRLRLGFVCRDSEFQPKTLWFRRPGAKFRTVFLIWCYLFFLKFSCYTRFLNKKHQHFGQGLEFLNFGQGNRGLNQQNHRKTGEKVRKHEGDQRISIRNFEIETLASCFKIYYLFIV